MTSGLVVSGGWRHGLCTLFAAGLVAGVGTAAAIDLYPTVATDGPDAVPGDGVCETVVGTGDCTLRAAIMEANALPGADVIHLAAQTYTLSISGVGEDLGATGDLDILGDLDLLGVSRAESIIDGGQLDRVLDIATGATVTLSNLTVTNGRLQGSPSSRGGGVRNLGILTATGIAIVANSNSSLSPVGGGVANGLGATLELLDTWIADNVVGNSSSGGGGGGLHNEGTASLDRVTLSTNRATATSFTSATGGGVSNNGVLTIVNATLSGNQAVGTLSYGGGIRNTGTLSIESSTFAENSGSGMLQQADCLFNDGSATLRHVILDSLTGANCDGSTPVTSLGFNLDSGSTCGLSAAGDLSSTGAALGALAFNGGMTPSHSPLPGSPVIDAGDDATCPATDQRGAPRPLDGDGDALAVCDIGAVEYFEHLFIDSFQSSDTSAWSLVMGAD